jgi:hypothetical protein
MPVGHLIGYYGPDDTGCRFGTNRIIGLPIGTYLGDRQGRQNLRVAPPKLGGIMVFGYDVPASEQGNPAMIHDPRYEQFRKLDLRPILFSVVERENGPRWNINLAMIVADWYRNFLYLVGLYPSEELVPTEAIDEFWHYHILDTLKYHADCQMLFGSYLHHFPYLGLRGGTDKDLLASKFRNTIALFVQHFRDDPATALRRIKAPVSLGSMSTAVCAGACAGTIGTEIGLDRPMLVEEEKNVF